MGNKWNKRVWDAPLLDWSAFVATFAQTGKATRKLSTPSGSATVTLKRRIATPGGYEGMVYLVAIGDIDGAWLMQLAEETLGLIVTGRAAHDAESGGWLITARLPVVEEVA